MRGGVAAAADWVEGAYTYVFRYQELEDKLEELIRQGSRFDSFTVKP